MSNGFDPEKARSDFLIAMYNQLMNDINRHIVVVWQSISALIGAFALWALVEKGLVSSDVAAALIIIVAFWVIAHACDAAYWYNRNLVMIANIERQFLKQTDLSEIHYYFGKHRSAGSMLTHLRLQLGLALGVALLALLNHFLSVILPTVAVGLVGTKPENFLPAAAFMAGLIVWRQMRETAAGKYKEFIENSPGRMVETTGVNYGIGHPTDESQ